MSIPREDELRTRLDFVKLDEAALQRIASLKPMVEAHIDDALSLFYEHVAAHDSVARFFRDPAHMDAAKQRQKSHWGALASGSMDDDYYATTLKVGHAHARIGMRPRWYIGGYALIVEHLVTGILTDYIASREKRGAFGFGRADKAQMSPAEFSTALSELIKAVFVDMDLAVSTYFDRTVQETKDLNEKISAVTKAAENGDFSMRIENHSTDPEVRGLSEGINNLVGAVDAALDGCPRGVAGPWPRPISPGAWTAPTRGCSPICSATPMPLPKSWSLSCPSLGRPHMASGRRPVRSSQAPTDLSGRTTKQAATLEETSDAMEKLAQTVTRQRQTGQCRQRSGASGLANRRGGR